MTTTELINLVERPNTVDRLCAFIAGAIFVALLFCFSCDRRAEPNVEPVNRSFKSSAPEQLRGPREIPKAGKPSE